MGFRAEGYIERKTANKKKRKNRIVYKKNEEKEEGEGIVYYRNDIC